MGLLDGIQRKQTEKFKREIAELRCENERLTAANKNKLLLVSTKAEMDMVKQIDKQVHELRAENARLKRLGGR